MNEGPSRPRILPVSSGDDQAPLNIFRTLAHNEALSKAFRRFGAHLLTGGCCQHASGRSSSSGSAGAVARSTSSASTTSLAPRWASPTRRSPDFADCGPGDWDEGDRALVALADELCEDDVVAEHTWRTLSQRWSDAELLELLVLAGFYRLVSGMLNSAGVALEPPTPRWPPDAVPVRRAPQRSSRDTPAGRAQGAGRGWRHQAEQRPRCAHGNGRAIAVTAARHGASVAISDLDGAAAEFTAALIAAQGGTSYALASDAADPGACVNTVEWAVGVLGVSTDSCSTWASASVVACRARPSRSGTPSSASISGPLPHVAAALPVMGDPSSTVLISSVAGLRPGSNIPSYDSSKAAQIGLMRHAGAGGCKQGRRVNLSHRASSTPRSGDFERGTTERVTTRVPLGGRARPRGR